MKGVGAHIKKPRYAEKCINDICTFDRRVWICVFMHFEGCHKLATSIFTLCNSNIVAPKSAMPHVGTLAPLLEMLLCDDNLCE